MAVLCSCCTARSVASASLGAVAWRAGRAHTKRVEPGSSVAACPRCGTAADVRTVQELFGMLNDMRAGVMRQAAQRDLPPPSSGTGWFPDPTFDGYHSDPGQGAADAVLGLAGHLFARKVGKRVRRAYAERIAPALDAQAQQAQQDWDQSLADQATIISRYPNLRGCLRDQVLFMAGGTEVVPISALQLPVTLAQADSLAARL